MKESFGLMERNTEGNVLVQGPRVQGVNNRQLKRRTGRLPDLKCRQARPLQIRRHLQMPCGINAFFTRSLYCLTFR
jgi:hypothetical protein